ncbi:hypothetical protein GCM10020254_83650 [Streptomyces goshikiensis]
MSARTRSGRVRGRPTPIRGTETCSNTRSNWGSVAVVSGCQDDGEGLASPVSSEVDLGGESAAGASQTLADADPAASSGDPVGGDGLAAAESRLVLAGTRTQSTGA